MPWDIWLVRFRATDATIVLVNVFINIYFVRCLWATKLIHPNLKIVMALNPSVSSIGGVARCLPIYLCVLDVPSTFVDDIIPYLSYINLFFHSGLGLVCAEMFLERLYATVKPENYDRVSSGHRCGTISIVTSSLYAAFLSSVSVYTHTVNPTKMLTLTDEKYILYSQPLRICYFWFAFGIISAPTSLAIIPMVNYNRRKIQQKGVGTLSTRYQYHENLNSLKVMLNMYIGIVVCCGFGLSAAVVIFVEIQKTDCDYIKIKALMKATEIAISSANFTVLVLAFTHPALKQVLLRDIPLYSNRRRSPEVLPYELTGKKDLRQAQETAVYFEQLQKSWT